MINGADMLNVREIAKIRLCEDSNVRDLNILRQILRNPKLFRF